MLKNSGRQACAEDLGKSFDMKHNRNQEHNRNQDASDLSSFVIINCNHHYLQIDEQATKGSREEGAVVL